MTQISREEYDKGVRPDYRTKEGKEEDEKEEKKEPKKK